MFLCFYVHYNKVELEVRPEMAREISREKEKMHKICLFLYNDVDVHYLN